MKGGDDLYLLIRSLSPAEKRTFTIHARRHMDEPHYLRLFEVLERLEDYDEDVIMDAFRGTAAEHHLPVVRHHLFAELITCLHRLPAEHGPTADLQHDAQAVAFLASRGCATTAERRLRKTILEARLLELPTVMLDLCSVHRSLHMGSPRLLRSILDDERHAMAMLAEHQSTALALLASEGALASFRLHGSARNLGDLHDGHTGIAQGATRLGRLRRERVRSRLSLIQGDLGKAKTHLIRALQHVIDVPHLADSHTADVVDLCCDCIDEACQADDMELLESVRVVLEAVATSSCGLPARRALAAVDTMADVARAVHRPNPMDTGIRRRARRDEDEVRRFLPVRARTSWDVRAAAFDILDDEPRSALMRCNDVLNDSSARAGNPLWYAQAHILCAAAHWALGNTDYLPTYVRATIRKAERKTLFSKEDLNVLRLILRMATGDDASVNAARSVLGTTRTPCSDVVALWFDEHTSGPHEQTLHVRAA
jgi:hypothetical protein